MVAPLGLGEPLEVGLEVVLGGPGGAVDPLQLRVPLRAAPVCRGAAHELEGVAEDLGRGHMRAAAQVAPGPGAVAPEVVVDGQLGPTDLDGHAFGALGVRHTTTLEPDELALVRLVGELGEGVGVGDLAAVEGLPLVDDPLHDLLEGLEVLGGERGLDVEVVVEAVTDRRADPEPGRGVDLLDGLGEHVGGAVPQDVEPVLLGRGHRLDGVAVGEDVGEVAELAVDPGDEDRPVVAEEVAGRRLLRHRSLASGDVDGDLGRHRSSSCAVAVSTGPDGCRPPAQGIERRPRAANPFHRPGQRSAFAGGPRVNRPVSSQWRSRSTVVSR